MGIELDSPNLTEIEKKYVTECIESGFISTYGPYVKRFEEAIGGVIDSPNVVAIQNGTAGIEMCLREIGVTDGDEVILPVMTFAATANPIIHLGATPVFVDVDKNTWNINPHEIKSNITKKTKAIIVVHLFGNPCEMDEIIRIANEYNLPIIEDACESIGATYKNKFTGTIAEYGVFSFNGNKIITTGGGGAISFKNNSSALNVKYLINQSKGIETMTDYIVPGFNYRMTNLQASLGLAQLERLSYFLKLKKEFSKIYKNLLGSNVKFQVENADSSSSHWFTSCIFENSNLLDIQKKLKDYGIPTRRIFAPLTNYKAYEKYSSQSYTNAQYIFDNALNLPCGTTNSFDDIKEVCRVLNMIL